MTKIKWNNLTLEEKERYIGFKKEGNYALVKAPEHVTFIFKDHLINNGTLTIEDFFKDKLKVCGGRPLNEKEKKVNLF